jgi:hypothetical protein
MSYPQPRTMNRCWPPPANPIEPERGTHSPITAGGRPTSQGLEHRHPTHLNKPSRRPGHSPHTSVRGTPPQASRHVKAKAPLTRNMLCPRWDSSCIPAAANTGNRLKHAESSPVRQRYGRVRRQKCGHCAHIFFHSRVTTATSCNRRLSYPRTPYARCPRRKVPCSMAPPSLMALFLAESRGQTPSKSTEIEESTSRGATLLVLSGPAIGLSKATTSRTTTRLYS